MTRFARIALILLLVFCCVTDWEVEGSNSLQSTAEASTLEIKLNHHHAIPVGLHLVTLRITEETLSLDPGRSACSFKAFSVPLDDILSAEVKYSRILFNSSGLFLSLNIRNPQNPKKSFSLKFASADSSLNQSGELVEAYNSRQTLQSVENTLNGKIRLFAKREEEDLARLEAARLEATRVELQRSTAPPDLKKPRRVDDSESKAKADRPAAYAQERKLTLADTAPEKRIALVIGNGNYDFSPLRNPVNDARDIAKALSALGFQVIHNENLNLTEMKRAIRAFGERIKNGGVGLFYFAGHGVQVNGQNYLIPVSATIEKEEEIEYESVDLGFVLAQMDNAKNRMNIVLLDACRNNAFARSFRSTTRGLASVNAPSGTLIAYATAPGSVASDGDAQNGLYTQELLTNMQVPGLSLQEVFKSVIASVQEKSRNRQVPWESSSLVGQFYFMPAINKAINGPDPKTVELLYWERIKATSNPADFQAYLRDYPNGMFVELARLRGQPASDPNMARLLPSVEELLERYSRAVGGRAAMKQISTLVQKGWSEVAYGQQKMTFEVEFYEKRPGKSLMITRRNNTISSKEIHNGSSGWLFNSKTGTIPSSPRQLEIHRHSVAWDQIDLDAIKQVYPTMVVKGVLRLGEREAYVLEATPHDGKTEKVHFDVDSGLVLRWDIVYDSPHTQQGLTIPTQVYFEEYAEIKGIKLPMVIRQVQPGGESKIRFDPLKLRLNEPLDDKLFSKP